MFDWWNKVYRPDLLKPKKPFDKHANHNHSKRTWHEHDKLNSSESLPENRTDEIRMNTSTPAAAPVVGIPFDAFVVPDDIWNVFWGFMNGLIDVFPEQSLPQFCRSNITQTYW